MRKVLLLALAVGLLVAAPAPAKTVTVDISRIGFVPSAVTIQQGDTVTWTNKDTVNHQVVCATCPFTSAPLSPGQSAQFTFAKVGKFSTVDPLNKNKKGTVNVEATPAAVGGSATPRVLDYGSATTISGTISTGQANQKVDILAQTCGENASKVVASATTTTGGAYTWQTQPALLTTYQVRYKPPTGNPVVSGLLPVSVRPIVGLGKSGRGKFLIRVVAAQSFVGKAVAFQRFVQKSRRWLTVKTAFLGVRAAASQPLAGTTVSSVSIKVNLKRGLRVRAVLPAGQAAPCYAAARSRTIFS
jgi:plastocyanin/ribosomal protein L37E